MHIDIYESLYARDYAIRIGHVVHAHRSHHSLTISLCEDMDSTIVEEACDFIWE